MTLGNRVAVMSEGIFQQVAPPMELYRRPVNEFVAGFVGSPAMNFFDCELGIEAALWRLTNDSLRLSLDGAGWREPAGRVTLGIRPHDIELVAPEQGDARARVDVVEPLGSEVLVHLELPSKAEAPFVRAILSPEREINEGDEVGLHFPPERVHLFDATSGKRLN